MEEKYSALFQPLSIGTVEVKNRFMMCPMEGTTIIGWLKGKGFCEEARIFTLNARRTASASWFPAAPR